MDEPMPAREKLRAESVPQHLRSDGPLSFDDVREIEARSVVDRVGVPAEGPRLGVGHAPPVVKIESGRLSEILVESGSVVQLWWYGLPVGRGDEPDPDMVEGYGADDVQWFRCPLYPAGYGDREDDGELAQVASLFEQVAVPLDDRA